MEQKLTLQPRLRAIADLVPRGSRLADIGTDHGYIPAALLLEGRIQSAIASDIGAEPLEHARRTARQYGLEGRVELRLGDGLRGISPEEADCIVIAGMGGDSITTILAAAPWTKTGCTLLLQPMSKAEVLRRWLSENEYCVAAEQLAADKGVIYPILTVGGGTMPPATDAQAWGGFLLGSDPLLGLYLDDRLLRLHRAAAGLERARDEGARAKRASLLALMGELEAMKGEWQQCQKREI